MKQEELVKELQRKGISEDSIREAIESGCRDLDSAVGWIESRRRVESRYTSDLRDNSALVYPL